MGFGGFGLGVLGLGFIGSTEQDTSKNVTTIGNDPGHGTMTMTTGRAHSSCRHFASTRTCDSTPASRSCAREMRDSSFGRADPVS